MHIVQSFNLWRNILTTIWNKYDWYDGNLVEKFVSGALWHGRILNSQCVYTENCVFKIHQS